MGRSPGLSLLYISTLALRVMFVVRSSGLSFLCESVILDSSEPTLSFERVSLKKGPTASIKRSLKPVIFLLEISSSFSLVRVWLHSNITSPVSGSTISFEATLSIISSASTGIFSMPALNIFFIASRVIFLSFFTMTSPVAGSFISRLGLCPARYSGATRLNICLPSRMISSLG